MVRQGFATDPVEDRPAARPVKREMVPIAADAARSSALPAWVYTDPSVLERETSAIFRRSWICLGHAGELEGRGSYITGYAGDQNIIVLRDGDGALRAFHNVCQHRAHPLLEGEGTIPRAIVCPYHAWTYELDGRLRGARGTERLPGFDRAKVCLSAVRVEVLHGLVFVNVDPEAEPLAAQAPGLAEEIGRAFPDLGTYRRIGTVRHEMRMNWKVRIDNSLECYHCQPVHKSFCAIVDMGRYRTTLGTRFSTQAGRVRGEGADEHSVIYWYVWPLTELNAGTLWPMFTVFHNRPLAVDRTLMTLKIYAPPHLGEEARREILGTWLENETNAEDQRLGEAVQGGLASLGYRQGRYVVDPEQHYSEHAVHHFHRMVAEALDLPREPDDADEQGRDQP